MTETQQTFWDRAPFIWGVLLMAGLYVNVLSRLVADETSFLDFIFPIFIAAVLLLFLIAGCGLVFEKLGLFAGVLSLAALTLFCFNLGFDGIEKISNNQLQKVEVIFRRCVDHSYPAWREKSLCVDGTTSPSAGRGTCSWHGGVSTSLPPPERTMTDAQCMIQARKISWLD